MLSTNVILMAIGFFTVVALVGGGFALRSFLKRRTFQNYLAEAKKSYYEGRENDALKLYLKAEKHWQLNSHDGGRGSLMQDLEQYVIIAAGVFKIVGKQSSHVRTDIQSLVAEMKSHLKVRENFAIDGRTMKSDAAERWKAMCERLESLRVELRGTCRPVMMR